MLLTSMINLQSSSIMQGKDATTFQAQLIEDPALAQSYFQNIRTFALSLIASLLAYVIVTLSIIGYSRRYLLRRSTKLVSWVFATLLGFVGLFLLVLVILLCRFILDMIAPSLTGHAIFVNGFLLASVILSLYYIVLYFHSFRRGKIVSSLSHLWQVVKTKRKNLLTSYLVSYVILLVLSGIFFYVKSWTSLIFVYGGIPLNTILDGLFFLAFISWLRQYVIQTIE